MPPPTVILKRNNNRIGRTFNEWAGFEFLSIIPEIRPHIPLFYGGDRQAGFILIEELGDIEGLLLMDTLSGDDPMLAEAALTESVKIVAKIHKATMGREREYRYFREDLPLTQGLAYRFGRSIQRFGEVVEALGVTPQPGFHAELKAIFDELIDPGPFLTYIDQDVGPHNWSASGLRLFDFEHGTFGHALLDGAQYRLRYLLWQGTRYPKPVQRRLENAYREVFVEGCPEAADDALFGRAVISTCAAWMTAIFFSHALRMVSRVNQPDQAIGTTTLWRSGLVSLEEFISVSEDWGQFEALRSTVREMEVHLRKRWASEVDRMTYHPAFTGD